MNTKEAADLFFRSLAWDMWADNLKLDVKASRDLKIQTSKFRRMMMEAQQRNFTDKTQSTALFYGMSSRKQSKKIGKLSVKLVQQERKVLARVEDAVQEYAEKQFKHRLTRADLNEQITLLKQYIEKMANDILSHVTHRLGVTLEQRKRK